MITSDNQNLQIQSYWKSNADIRMFYKFPIQTPEGVFFKFKMQKKKLANAQPYAGNCNRLGNSRNRFKL